MAMRLNEVHPSLVHFPLALYPATLAADALGRVSGSRSLLAVGKWGIAATVGTGALAAVAGLIAQQEVSAGEGRARDMLITHRTLNAGFLALTATMAARRFRRRRPSLRYLAAGLAGLGTALYSAYLGGHMVYEFGVGVKAAGGIQEGHGPRLERERAGEIARHALDDARAAVRYAVEQTGRGEIIPALTREQPPEAAGGAPWSGPPS